MSVTVPPLVPLESGDRLTRDEFHRRYCARPDIRKAELVKGVVYVASPTRMSAHGEPHGAVAFWLRAYRMRTPGVRLGVEATIFLSDDGEVQPDACLFWARTEGAGGARETDDGYIEGAPDLIVEIAASSASYDLHDKLEMYQQAGVPEYAVWRVLDRQFDWFRLRDGRYVRLEPDERGVIASEVFPGLRLAVDRLLAGDDAGVLAELDAPQAG
jgi:Uma2 family endonuclease